MYKQVSAHSSQLPGLSLVVAQWSNLRTTYWPLCLQSAAVWPASVFRICARLRSNDCYWRYRPLLAAAGGRQSAPAEISQLLSWPLLWFSVPSPAPNTGLLMHNVFRVKLIWTFLNGEYIVWIELMIQLIAISQKYCQNTKQNRVADW